MKKLLLAVAISSVALFASAEDNTNYWVWPGGYTVAETDVVIPTSFDHWWACDFNGDVADETVLGGKCLSFTGQPGGYGAFSYGIANKWGDLSFTNDVLRDLNLYFFAKCAGPETEETYVKLTAHTNVADGSSEVAGQEVRYDLPLDGEWHVITMNVKTDFPDIYAAWEKDPKGYVFSASNKGVDGKESESTIYIGPIWYAAKNTITETVPCEGVEFAENTVSLLEGYGVQLEYVLTPADTTDPVYFESSNAEVATVDSKGFVEGIAEGEAVITVSCGSFSDTCNVTVKKESGIEAINADAENGEEVFFNLQGVRVNNPENGMFIRVAGGKAVKVVK